AAGAAWDIVPSLTSHRKHPSDNRNIVRQSKILVRIFKELLILSKTFKLGLSEVCFLWLVSEGTISQAAPA
ncbi:hypothetical protein NE588_15955, partial [Faecalibacterium prausnitzii]|uniref:hypothetical protein n=1 Tax=Faecalibacterium prausnitzii TaxID=853 RepID=UPI00210DACB5